MDTSLSTQVLPLAESLYMIRALYDVDFYAVALLGGDRLNCCDYVVVARQEGNTLAVATISLQGENGDGHPTIVAVYTHPVYRRQGFGKRVFLTAVEYCRDTLHLTRLRVDVVTNEGKLLVQSVPDVVSYLDIHYYP